MKKPLPGSSNAIIFGILSIVLTVFCCGPFGAIFSFIGLSYAKKAHETYTQNTAEYSDYSNVKIAKVLSYIGIALAGVYLALIILYFGVITALILSTNS